MVIDNIKVKVTRKKIKNMYLRVEPPDGEVLISAPSHMKDQDIKRFVAAHKEWISAQQNKISETCAGSQLLDGQGAMVFGVEKTIRIKTSYQKPVATLEGDSIVLKLPPDHSYETREKALDSLYRQLLKAQLDTRLPVWERKTGLHTNQCRIKKMKTRWGSCNPQAKRVWVALEMAKKPPECLDYLLVHELCHMLEPNHSKKFWNHVEGFMPDYKERRKLLQK